jgi:hypothetical protein
MRLPARRHTFTRNGAIREHLTLDDHGPCRQACARLAPMITTSAWPEGDHGMEVLLLRTASLLQGQLLRCIVDGVRMEHVRHCVTLWIRVSTPDSQEPWELTPSSWPASTHRARHWANGGRDRCGSRSTAPSGTPDHQQPPYQDVSERQRKHGSGKNDEHCTIGGMTRRKSVTRQWGAYDELSRWLRSVERDLEDGDQACRCRQRSEQGKGQQDSDCSRRASKRSPNQRLAAIWACVRPTAVSVWRCARGRPSVTVS